MHLYFYQLKKEYHTEILQFNEQDEFVLTVVFKMICCFLASSCKEKENPWVCEMQMFIYCQTSN